MVRNSRFGITLVDTLVALCLVAVAGLSLAPLVAATVVHLDQHTLRMRAVLMQQQAVVALWDGVCSPQRPLAQETAPRLWQDHRLHRFHDHLEARLQTGWIGSPLTGSRTAHLHWEVAAQCE